MDCGTGPIQLPLTGGFKAETASGASLRSAKSGPDYGGRSLERAGGPQAVTPEANGRRVVGNCVEIGRRDSVIAKMNDYSV
jgi:hypothetical protein